MIAVICYMENEFLRMSIDEKCISKPHFVDLKEMKMGVWHHLIKCIPRNADMPDTAGQLHYWLG